MESALNSEIPILNCSLISDGIYNADLQHSPQFKQFATQLGNGMNRMGLVYLVNHGVDETIIHNVLSTSKNFFDLPPPSKSKYDKGDKLKYYNGYFPPRGDFKESFSFVGRQICQKEAYPCEVPQLFDAITAFHDRLTNLSKKMLLGLALYLELDDPEFFVKQHKYIDDIFNRDVVPLGTIKTRLYHAISDEDLEKMGDNPIRLPEHPDRSTLTFLIQDDSGGLEAKNEDGKYVSVPRIPGSMVMNAGLFLETWTGGNIAATMHQVRLVKETAKSPRQSLAWFLLPDAHTTIDILVGKKKGWAISPLAPKPGVQDLIDFFQHDIKYQMENYYDTDDWKKF